MSERRYAVLIGSSKFPDEPRLDPLRCPENDVDGLNTILKTCGDFPAPIVLKNVRSHEALEKINDTLAAAHRDGFALIYYSGHGKLDLHGRLYLATSNTVIDKLVTTSIPVETIRACIETSGCRKVVLMLDCCYSGAAGTSFKGSAEDQLQRLATEGSGRYLMTASTGTQLAVEKEGDQYGVFTKHIIDGIGSGEADLDHDGYVKMDELYDYVHKQMSEEGYQKPTKWALDVRGDLIIARAQPQRIVDTESAEANVMRYLGQRLVLNPEPPKAGESSLHHAGVWRVDQLKKKLEEEKDWRDNSITVEGTFVPRFLLVPGWWDRSASVESSSPFSCPDRLDEGKECLKDWLFHGFESWAPSWDVRTPGTNNMLVGQLAQEDEAESLCVVLPGRELAEKVLRLCEEAGWGGFRVQDAADPSPRGFEARVTGSLRRRSSGIVSSLSLKRSYAYYIRVWDVQPCPGKPTTERYTGYLWQCLAPKDAFEKAGESLQMRDVFFVWEHTDFTRKAAVQFNADALRSKLDYVQKHYGRNGVVLLQASDPIVRSGAKIPIEKFPAWNWTLF